MEVLWEKKSCWPSSVHDHGGGGGAIDYEDDDVDIDNGSYLLNICLRTASHRTFHIKHSQETGSLENIISINSINPNTIITITVSINTYTIDQNHPNSYDYYPARALGLLLADGAPTVGGGKTF